MPICVHSAYLCTQCLTVCPVPIVCTVPICVPCACVPIMCTVLICVLCAYRVHSAYLSVCLSCAQCLSVCPVPVMCTEPVCVHSAYLYSLWCSKKKGRKETRQGGRRDRGWFHGVHYSEREMVIAKARGSMGGRQSSPAAAAL